MSVYLNYDGELVKTDQPIIKADNRGLRYGDGLFETMRLKDGRIWLAEDHFDRLLAGMRLLSFDVPDHFTPGYLQRQVMELCKKNHLNKNARIRLMVFRGSGSLYDPENHLPHYIIEATELNDETLRINAKGLSLGVYTRARKSIDEFSHLKTNNYLPYVQAAIFARKQGWDDCLLINTEGFICDSTIANIFILQDKLITTPPLSQGCVAGVMRKNLLSLLPGLGFTVKESPLSLQLIQQADEIFLSNSVYGIRWVAELEGAIYTNQAAGKIFDAIILES